MPTNNNTEGFLRLPDSPSMPSVTPGSINYTESSVQGGHVQLGATSKQVGKSSEQLMYEALSDAASGIKQGISTFTEIRGKMEEDQIAEAKLKFKTIYSGDYTETKDADGKVVRQYENPEAKMEEWNKYISQVWTPLLGDVWARDLNVDAYSYFGNRESQNKFEEGRYGREWSKYLQKNPLLNPESVESKIEFDKHYADKYTTAESNEWFKLNQLVHRGEFNSRNEQEAKAALDLAVRRIIPIPTEDEFKLSQTNSPEASDVRSKFTVFFDLVGKTSTQGKEETAQMMLSILETELIKKNPYKYEPHVLKELTRVLPVAARGYAEELQRSAFAARRMEAKEKSATTLQNNTVMFEASKPAELQVNFYKYLDALVANLPNLEVTPASREAFFQSFLTHGWTTWNKSIETHADEIPIPDAELGMWGSRTAFEKLDIVRSKMKAWLDSESTVVVMENGKLVSKPLSNRGRIAKQLGSNEAYVDKLMNDPVFIKSSKEFQSEVSRDAENRSKQLTSNLTTLGNINVPDKVIEFGGKAIDVVADRWGITRDELRGLYLDKTDDTIRATRDINAWFKGLDEKSRKRMLERGFTPAQPSSEFFSSVEQAVQIENGIINKTNELATRAASGNEDTGKELAKILRDSENVYSGNQVEAQASKGNIATAILTGEIFTPEMREFNAFIALRDQAGSVLTDTQEDSADMSIQERLTRDSLRVHGPLFGDSRMQALFQAVDSAKSDFTIRGLELVEAQQSYIRDPASWTPEKRAEHRKMLDRAWNKLLQGKASKMDGSIPTNLMDSNGEFTEDGYLFVIRAGMLGDRLLAGSIEDQKNFGKNLKGMLEQLGNLTDTQAVLSDPSKAPVFMALVSLGRGYKKAYEDGRGTMPGNAKYFMDRLLLFGNASEDLSFGSVAKFFNSPETAENSQLTVAIAYQLAREAVGSSEFQTAYETSSASGVTLTRYIPKRKAGRILSAIGSQLTEDVQLALDTAAAGGEGVDISSIKGKTPYDPEWDYTKFITVFKESGLVDETLTEDEFASALKRTILVGVLDDSYGSRTNQETITMAARLLYEQGKENSNPLLYALDLASGPVGINHPMFDTSKTPNPVVHRTELLFQYLSSCLDIDDAMKTPENFRKEGLATTDSFFNTYFVETERGKFERFRSFRGNTEETGFNALSLRTLQIRESFSIFPEDFQQYRKMIQGEYNPPVDPRTSEKQESVLYKTGSLILQLDPSNEVLLTMIKPWIEANASSSAVLIPGYRGLPLAVTPEILRSLLLKDKSKVIASREFKNNPAVQAIASVMGTDGNVEEKLRRLQDVYTALGGTIPLIDEKKWDRKRNGFSAIGQNFHKHRIKSPETILPTWDWAATSISTGIPMITLSDAVFRGLDSEGTTAFNSVRARLLKYKEGVKANERRRQELETERLKNSRFGLGGSPI